MQYKSRREIIEAQIRTIERMQEEINTLLEMNTTLRSQLVE